MPFGSFRLNTLSAALASVLTAEFGLYKVLNDPTAYGTSASDNFGYSVSVSNNYIIVSAPYEADAGGINSGKAYIYSTSTGSLLYTINNPTPVGTSAGDNFGYSVAISDTYAIIGAPAEDDASGASSGKAYIYSTSTGSLVYTLNNPTAYTTGAGDNFGWSVAISDNYAIVGAYLEGDAGGTQSGKAYIYSTSTGSLLYTLDNPNPYSTSAGDRFGTSVSISNSYAIVSAYLEDDAGGTQSGKAYIYSTSTGSLLYTLDNPNPYSTSVNDYFGISVAINENYAIVGAYGEDDATGTDSGKAYIYSTSTGSLLYTLDNPTAYSSGASDVFGETVGISDSYAIVGAKSEDEASGLGSGKAYIYSLATGSLLYTLDNPNAFGSTVNDNFGFGISINDNFAVIAAYNEDDAGGFQAGKAYVYSANPADHITPSSSGVQYIGVTNSIATTVSIPSLALLGDIAVLVDTSTTVTDVVPSGWTSISGVTTTGIRTNISYKILGEGEAGTSVTGMAGTTRKSLLIFRNAVTTSSTISITTPSAQATTAAPTNQTITAGSGVSIYFAAYAKTTVTVPTRGWTQTGGPTPSETSSVSTSGVYTKWAIYNTGANAPTHANATISMTDAGTNTLQSFRMDIS